MNVKELVKKALDNPAMENIRDVLVIQLINIVAQVPVMPEAQARPAVANMPGVRVPAAMSGQAGLVKKRHKMELLEICIIVMVRLSELKLQE